MYIVMKYFYLIALSSFLSIYAQSNDTNPKGLMVDSEVPIFTALNQNSEEVSLKKLLQNGPVMLVFYRGYWCPVCSRHLKSLEDGLHLLKAKGIQVIAVSQEVPERIAITVANSRATYHVSHDKDGIISRAYNVLYTLDEVQRKSYDDHLDAALGQANSNGSITLHIPATFLIQPNGKIAFRHFDPDYKKRATISDILGFVEDPHWVHQFK